LGFYVNETPSGWVEVNGALEREFEFADFADALAFVNRVGAAAEEANHHPDVEIHWNRVKLRWWTHVTGSITDRDRELAARTDELF
jgi:4a-hydroxytetrahydrobiopterin dehydratase